MTYQFPEGTEPYQLPDGTIVRIDATASRGASVIDFQLKGGRIVEAVAVRGTLQYRVTAERAWTGNQFGEEWRLGWVVHRVKTPVPGEGPFEVYTDDSIGLDGKPRPDRGNGDFEQSFATFDEACRWADQRAVLADERGF